MKRAFSLVELCLVCVLFGAIFYLLLKPAQNLYGLYASAYYQRPALLNLNSSLIFLSKILKDCVEFRAFAGGFECLSEDSQNLILSRDNAYFIGSAGVLLKDANASFYAPQSHFLYEFKNGKKVETAGVLENFNNIFGLQGDKIYLYETNARKIHALRVLDGEKLEFTGFESFAGFYKLIFGTQSVFLKNNALHYAASPASDGFNAINSALKSTTNATLPSTNFLISNTQQGILLDRVREFSVLLNQNADKTSIFHIKLCLEFNDFCFEKEVVRD